MKELYVTPEVEVIVLGSEDIITTSGDDLDDDELPIIKPEP